MAKFHLVFVSREMAGPHENPKSEIPLPKSSVAIVIPDVGAGGAVLRVSAWYVEPGDSVDAGEPVLEVMIPGVTCDVPAPIAGTITRLDRPLDAVVAPGDVVAWIVPK
ncbi:MAG: hypothetical protein HY290_21390 [Planctomycetia bacterium]|nr:hypothetical protein [Planctomycetia bacterium]